MAGQEVLDAARAAVATNDWREAYQLLSKAHSARPLDNGEALELLANAAYLTGRADESLDAWQATHRARVADEEKVPAALAAVRAASLLLEGGSATQAEAWLKRAERLLEGMSETPIHAWIAATRSLAGLFSGDPATVREQGELARDIGRRVGDPDVEAIGVNGIARAMIMEGALDEGLAMMDELSVAAAAGELGPIASGYIYCSTVCAAQSVGDYRRSEEWTAEMERLGRSTGLPYISGRCRVHRAELYRLRGEWSQAEAEARTACDELRRCGPVDIGWALAELGVVRLRRGDLEGAEEAFHEARQRGREAHPGIALLLLARGDVSRAATAINDAVEDPPEWPSWEAPLNTLLGRAQLLPAQVEIALAADDFERSRSAADELAGIAERFPTVALRAAAAEARGRLDVATGENEAGRRALQAALRLWAEVDAPFEMARVRMVIASAHRSAGDEDAARVELDAARLAFERLSAVLDAQRATELGGEARAPDVRRVTRTFMFTDIVRSTDLAELIGDEAWQQLKRWHDELISSLVGDHGGEVVDNTGDGFFAAFPDAPHGVRAAIAIQRALATHRRSAGFAPRIRIGLHQADASRAGSNYSGLGVHAAARIAAQGQADEILASRATADASGHPIDPSATRSLPLKGISEPIEAVAVGWR
ncbi:MAG: transcriptional regulator [Chloroflexi bacterium]|nr:transcriptional regulator [Chloroflexota bacterium]